MATEREGTFLLRKQRNEVFELISGAGLDPASFTWRREHQFDEIMEYFGTTATLRHEPSRFYFRIIRSWDGRRLKAQYSPGQNTRRPRTIKRLEWSQILQEVKAWAQTLYSEVEEPDLWAIATTSTFAEVPEAVDSDVRFTDPELDHLNRRLDQIEARLVSSVDTQDLEVASRQLIAHLRVEARQQGRRNWYFLALGSLTSFMVNASFDPERAREILAFLVESVQALNNG